MKKTGANKTSIKSSQHPDAYTTLRQPRHTYLTTYQLADELGEWLLSTGRLTLSPEGKIQGGNLPYPEQTLRWCKRWFGDLPAERIGGQKRGYRIPLNHRYVARAWLQTTDEQTRQVVERILVTDPRPWVVVVGKFGSSHYSVDEVVERLRQVLPMTNQLAQVIQIFNVGPVEDESG